MNRFSWQDIIPAQLHVVLMEKKTPGDLMKVEMCTKNFTIDLSVKRLAEMMPESPDHPVVEGSG